MSLANLLAEMDQEPVRFSAGQMLFLRDARVHHLFLVNLGLVHLARYQANGALTVMQRAGEGHIVAEASIFASNYHCNAIAVTNVEATRLSMDVVRARLGTDCTFARACAEHLAGEVQRMRIRSEILAMKTVSERLQAWTDLHGMPPKGQWSALADDIGISREALYRELAKVRHCE